MFQTTIM